MNSPRSALAQQQFEQGLAAYRQARYREARAVFESLVQENSKDYEVLNWLGATALSQQDFVAAEQALKHLIRLQPQSVGVYNNLGVCYQRMGRVAEAIAAYEQAQLLDSEHIDSRNNLRQLYAQKQKNETITAHSARLLQLLAQGKIDNDENRWHNLAETARHQGNTQGALKYCQTAIESGLISANLYAHLGDCWRYLGRVDEAEQAYQQAIHIEPSHFYAHRGYGILLCSRQKYTQAEPILRKAIELNPNDSTLWTNLGNAYSQTWRIEQAITCYQEGEQRAPNDALPAAAHLFNLNYLPDATAADIYWQALMVGTRCQKDKPVYTAWLSDGLDTRPEQLNIGFVSGDLRNHAVGYFLNDIVKHLDKSRFAWHAFSNHAHTNDATERALKSQMASWSSIVGASTEHARSLIHEQNIHILIDLAGHTAGNRSGVFACRPAPLQMTWLGWFVTTGLPTMDYLLTDHISVQGIENYFSEELLYLPRTRLCMSTPTDVIEVSASPAQSNEFLTFGCVQNLAKITDEVLAQWGQLLHILPRARLQMQAKQLDDEERKAHLIERARVAGIPIDRLILVPPSNREQYLKNFARIDILLDTHPYPGGTTTAEGLWMGVPTLTMMGDTMISRQGASLLTAAGLSDWVARDGQDYLQKAVYWANHIDELAQLRQGLRARVARSPLFDAPLFARDFEAVLDLAWEKHLHRKLAKSHKNQA